MPKRVVLRERVPAGEKDEGTLLPPVIFVRKVNPSKVDLRRCFMNLPDALQIHRR